MNPVLVTGATGYLGTRVVADLLRDGLPVRAVVRSAGDLRDAVRRGGADPGGLEIVTELDFRGVTEVHHLASPMVEPEGMVEAARTAALDVLRGARDAGVRRVVLTSSFAAIGYSPKEVRDYTEDDWTDPSTPGLAPYPRSKAVAERAAWDFMEREGGDTELVVLNPTWIAGPTLTSGVRSSLQFFQALLDGSMTVVPRQRFGIADVRDVAWAHLAAMRTPVAAGRRYLLLADGPTMTFREVAKRIGVDVAEAPGDEPAPLTIHNERAKQELGFRPRPASTTLRETVESVRSLGRAAT